MSIIFPPNPPVEFDSSLDALLALFLSMPRAQKVQIAQLLIQSLPNAQVGEDRPDVGQAFINHSGFVVEAQ